MGAPSSSALGVSRASGFVPSSYSSESWSQSDWYNAAQREKGNGSFARKNAIPVLIYLDIFKNYFANTQEENFYMITGDAEAKVTFQQLGVDLFTIQVGENAKITLPTPISNTTKLKASDNVKNYTDFWKSVKIRFQNPTTGQYKESYINYLTSNGNTQSHLS